MLRNNIYTDCNNFDKAGCGGMCRVLVEVPPTGSIQCSLVELQHSQLQPQALHLRRVEFIIRRPPETNGCQPQCAAHYTVAGEKLYWESGGATAN